MKIEQGYTLSQFIDFIMSYEDMTGWGRACTIETYNNFLKQPLSKDMFVNGVEMPKKPLGYDTWKEGNGGADGIACVRYNNQFNAWQEAEKKVIFKGWRRGQGDIYNDKMQIVYNVKSNSIFINNWIFNPTLNDLFEATKGQLKLKNVEL